MLAIDRKTRKLFTIYGGLHLKSDVDSLYILRKDGGGGLIAIEDCAELAASGLEVYVHGSEERLIQAAGGYMVEGLEAATVLKKAKKEKRLQDREEKALHGQYLSQTKIVRSELSWIWLQNGDLKEETESLTVSAQNQSIRTKLVKGKIHKTQRNTRYADCVRKLMKV